MIELNRKLRHITEKILFSEADFGKQFSACNELYRFFSELTEIEHSSANAEDAIQTKLEGGKAISPKEAAHCVLDFARTTQFLRGIYAAIIELQKRFSTETLEILYAGCGPYAALIAPLLTLFQPKDLRLTLIDIHQRSIAGVEKIISELKFEDFIAEILCADAITYQDDTKPHLIICESMQNALQKEPQFALTLNLAPQLIENGIFIPQKISVQACLANSSKEFSTEGEERERIYLGEIFNLEAEKLIAVDKAQEKIIEIPQTNIENADFMLLTKVEIFDRFGLNDYDSGISYPLTLKELKNLSIGNRIAFKYIFDSNPRFEYRIL